MTDKYSAMDIANYIVWYVNRDNANLPKDLTPLKLQKILYYVATAYFQKTKERLFEEDIQKWQYGPVVKEVYHQFKSFGFHHIAKPKSTMIRDDRNPLSFTRQEYNHLEISGNTDFLQVAEVVIKNYAPWKAFDLVERTHKENAWKDCESKIMKGMDLVYSDSELSNAKTIKSS